MRILRAWVLTWPKAITAKGVEAQSRASVSQLQTPLLLLHAMLPPTDDHKWSKILNNPQRVTHPLLENLLQKEVTNDSCPPPSAGPHLTNNPCVETPRLPSWVFSQDGPLLLSYCDPYGDMCLSSLIQLGNSQTASKSIWNVQGQERKIGEKRFYQHCGEGLS